MKHLFFRLVFLIFCLIPFGMLMYLGKPERLQGILFDIENYIGLKNFCLFLFISGCTLIGVEALWLFIKNKGQSLSRLSLLLFFVPLAFYISSQDIFYKKEIITPSKVTQSTLLLATEGSVYNFNLDDFKLSWQYDSPWDLADGNRNSFVVDGQNLFIPFESGGFKNIDINTGNIIWETQIFGRENSGISNGERVTLGKIKTIRPLFMSKPLVDTENIVIASHGQPKTTRPFLYSFDKTTGKTLWQKRIQTYNNYFAPVKFKGTRFNYYFVNSAVYLEVYGANTGSRVSYGMYSSDKQGEQNRFSSPIYNQMQTDGRSLFIGDEKGKFYSLPLDANGKVSKSDYHDPNNTFSKNPEIFNWIYSDEDYKLPSNKITYLENKILFAGVNKSSGNKSAIIAINTDDGVLNWKKELPGGIQSWSLIGNDIYGYTDENIFRMDASGENYLELEFQNRPISNIERVDSSNVVYLTEKGIEIYDLQKRISTLVIAREFTDKSHNNVQIKYIGK